MKSLQDSAYSNKVLVAWIHYKRVLWQLCTLCKAAGQVLCINISLNVSAGR